MSKSRHWSSGSAPCRLEWGPSRLLAGSLALLGVLAAASVLGSEMAVAVALPAALAVFGHGLWLGLRVLRQPLRTVFFPFGDGAASIDGAPVTHVEVQWRGPLAFVKWRDLQGRCQRTQVWPDTLPAKARRELRLAMIRRGAAPAAGSMAP